MTVIRCCFCCRLHCHRHCTPIRHCPVFDKGVYLAMVCCLCPQVKLGGGVCVCVRACKIWLIFIHHIKSDKGYPFLRPTAEGQFYLMVQAESSVGGDGAIPQLLFLECCIWIIQWAVPNWSAIVIKVMVVMVMVTILRTLYLIIVFVTYTV